MSNKSTCGLTAPEQKKVTVLFTQANSIYKELGTDNWDIHRDATKWKGGNAIIAHPPCRAWGNYAQWAKPRPGEKYLAIWAIRQARMHGGIVEHPRRSRLWKRLKITANGKPDHWGGYAISIDQFWFGHRAKKDTWLYIKGITLQKLPLIPIRFDSITHNVEMMGKKEREATPRKLAEWLIQTAELINANK